jgi:serine/threonine-protein kinase PpkA
LIGFRGDTSYNPRLEYWTRIFHPLEISRDANAVKADASAMHEAPVSTAGWNEDVVAGLDEAIEHMNWDGFDSRIVVLLTDAGPRRPKDGHVLHPDLSIDDIVALADRRSIAIYPVHLLTSEAVKAHDTAYAEAEYKRLGLTGDGTTQKYVAIPAGSVSELAARLDEFTSSFVDALAHFWRENRSITEGDVRAKSGVGRLVFSELFRAQFEYLAKVGGGVPRYTAWWTTDADLTNPTALTMQPEVFLTRNQLGGLAQALDRVLATLKDSNPKPRTFLNSLQNIAAGVSYDPSKRTAGVFDDLAGNDKLAAYLRALPYRSEALSMTGDAFDRSTLSDQEELRAVLSGKLSDYRRLDSDQDAWTRVPGSDRELDLARLDLQRLP